MPFRRRLTCSPTAAEAGPSPRALPLWKDTRARRGQTTTTSDAAEGTPGLPTLRRRTGPAYPQLQQRSPNSGPGRRQAGRRLKTSPPAGPRQLPCPCPRAVLLRQREAVGGHFGFGRKPKETGAVGSLKIKSGQVGSSYSKTRRDAIFTGLRGCGSSGGTGGHRPEARPGAAPTRRRGRPPPRWRRGRRCRSARLPGPSLWCRRDRPQVPLPWPPPRGEARVAEPQGPKSGRSPPASRRYPGPTPRSRRGRAEPGREGGR